MDASSQPCEILIVDDHPDDVSPLKLNFEGQGASVEVCKPDDVTQKQIIVAKVVLVDFEFDEWVRDAGELYEQDAPIGRLPVDGLALASVLRRHVQDTEHPPTAFVILTGQLPVLGGVLPGEYRNHALARINNLEWVFEKSLPASSLVRQVMSLRHAVLQLPARWLPDQNEHSLNTLLKLLCAHETTSGADNAAIREDVMRCLPPLHEISQWSHGITVLRWLLHRILPYPCFLLSTQYLAARLGIDDTALKAELAREDSPLRAALSGCEYKGILHDFDSLRWWRSEVELWLWQGTQGRASNLDAVREFVGSQVGGSLAPSEPLYHPVVCIGDDYQAVTGFTSIDDAVRLQPDDWPPYASSAWASLEQVGEADGSDKLRSMVVEADREKLD